MDKISYELGYVANRKSRQQNISLELAYCTLAASSAVGPGNSRVMLSRTLRLAYRRQYCCTKLHSILDAADWLLCTMVQERTRYSSQAGDKTWLRPPYRFNTHPSRAYRLCNLIFSRYRRNCATQEMRGRTTAQSPRASQSNRGRTIQPRFQY